ncbi:MAG: TlpA family protein disulfide reductase [Nocardioidaceae bacterium]
MTYRFRVLAAATLLVTSLAGVAACSTAGADPGGQGYVSGDGSIITVPASQRSEKPDLSGIALTGQKLSLSSYAGHVTVVNVWGSWCSDCRVETPSLVAASKRLAPQGVHFLGVDIRDNPDAARAYEKAHGITWPSLNDPSSQTLLAFQKYPAMAPPTTYVIDPQGRVAARVLGPITETTLVDLVKGVLHG